MAGGGPGYISSKDRCKAFIDAVLELRPEPNSGGALQHFAQPEENDAERGAGVRQNAPDVSWELKM